jgi:predicted nucleic acid-binding protein
MIVLLDTNVVFDVVSKRQPHYSASNLILCLCRRKALVGTVAFHTIANCFNEYGKSVVLFLRERLLRDVEVVAASSSGILDALSWGIRDMEAALQAAAALNIGASFVLTRNVKDFRRSRVPALSPSDFLNRFHPA